MNISPLSIGAFANKAFKIFVGAIILCSTITYFPVLGFGVTTDEVVNQIFEDVKNSNFVKVDQAIDQLVVTQEVDSSGKMKAQVVFDKLQEQFVGSDFSREIAYFNKLEVWKKQVPTSATPYLLRARSLLLHGQELRGHGYSYTVAAGNRSKYRELVGAAAAELEQAERVSPKNLLIYPLKLSIMRSGESSKEEAYKVFYEGLAVSQKNEKLYSRMAELLLVRWGGDPGEVERFAKDISRTIGGSAGNVIYARILSHLHTADPFEFRANYKIEWPLVVEAFRAYQSVYPSSPEANCLLAKLSSEFYEQKVAKEEFLKLPVSWNEALGFCWSDESYQKWRSWALENSEYPGFNQVERLIVDNLALELADLVVKDPELLNRQGRYGMTPLLLAISLDRNSIVKYLLSQGKIDLEKKSSKGKTALYLAVNNGALEIVQQLLERGANPNTTRDESKWTPLHVAARNGYRAIASALLKSNTIDPNAKTSNGETSLYIAAYFRQLPIVKLLLAKDKTEVNAATKTGWTALHAASRKGGTSDSLAIVEILIDRGANVNSQNDQGNTPLHIAAYYQFKDEVEVLLSRGKANMALENKKKELPVYFIVTQDNVPLLQLFLKKGANLSNPINRHGHSMLHVAARDGRIEVIKFLTSLQEIDINLLTEEKRSPLMLAFSNGRFEAANLLLKDARINKALIDDSGRTLMHHAVYGGNLELVKLAEQLGNPVDSATNKGWRAIHIAAERGNASVVKYLLSKGAQSDVKNNAGDTPLELARQNKHQEVVALLESEPRK